MIQQITWTCEKCGAVGGFSYDTNDGIDWLNTEIRKHHTEMFRVEQCSWDVSRIIINTLRSEMS